MGLGPAGPDLLTAGTIALIDEVSRSGVVRLRTDRHPAAEAVAAPSFDHHYEGHDTFEAVYDAIVADLVSLAREHGRVLYLVPGSPAVAEHTVELLIERRSDQLEVVVHPALSFADLSWVALGIDPIAEGVRIIDGHRFATEAAGERGPLLVSQCHDRATLSEIKLAVDAGPETTVIVVQRLGLPDQHIAEVAWPELDREIEPDHLTSLYVPHLPNPVGTAFSRFAVLVERLRAECPWDAEQDHGTLRRYLLEESYETLEALDHLVEAHETDHGSIVEQRYADLQEELGDLLYQVFFHSILAEEQGWFDVADVARGIHDKLYERHPHVFGEVEVGLDELAVRWEEQKKAEKDRASVMDGIPAALPALIYTTKVQKKAWAVDYPDPSAAPQLDIADADELGALLWEAVGAARELGIDPESVLRERAVAFADRVRAFEAS